MFSYPIQVQTRYSYAPFCCPALDLIPRILHKYLLSFLQFCDSFLQVVQGYKHWRNVNVIFHKTQQGRHNGVRSEDRGVQDVDRPSRNHSSSTSYSRRFSLHFGCLVSFLHLEDQYLVCLQVPGNHPHRQNVAVDIPLTVCHKVENLFDMWRVRNGTYSDLA